MSPVFANWRLGTLIAESLCMRRAGNSLVEGSRRANTPELSLERLRTVLAHLAPVSLLRANWRRPEESLEPRVRRLVSERLGLDAEDLAAEVSLTDDLAADSLDLIDVAIALEEEFGITLPESVIDELRTYGQLVEVVQLRVGERRAHEAEAESERTPPFIWARILPGFTDPSGSVERIGWLTPYTLETIVYSALRAGPGARLEMGVPPNLGEAAMTQLRNEFAWLGRRHIGVQVRRDPQLPPLGAAA
jgi:acyl carrier protein